MPSPLARRVARTIGARTLWAAGDRVAVAVSGGADSVALLLLLAELAPRAPWALCGVIHVEHGLRGTESLEDAEFCRRLASRLDLPFDLTHVNTREAAAAGHRSIEAAARTLRYAAFEGAAPRLGATVVATGHSRDDQAETVLLRLLRGAAARGVSAIRSRRGLYARPILECRRVELRRYLAAAGEPFREDASNADLAVPRNRLRHELLPVVEGAWPGGIAALARFAELAADDERWLSGEAARQQGVIRIGADGVELDRGRLNALPPPLARRVVRAALEQSGGRAAFREIEAVRRLARAARRRARIDLHGLVAERVEDTISLGPRHVPDRPVQFAAELPVPGEVRFAETCITVRASFHKGPERPTLSPGWEAIAALQASAVDLPLTVRNRRPGDRMTPLGAPGTKLLQDLFVDCKVPRERRGAVPVVVDAAGRIVWVAGVATAERCRVRAPESGMVILESQKGKP